MTRISPILIGGWILLQIAALQELAAQDRNVAYTNQQWVQYYGQFLLSDTWILQGDTGFRWREGLQEKSQYLIRLGMGYRISPSWQAATGIFFAGNYGPEQVDQTEFRPYQDLTYRTEIKKVDINQRFRVEERFLHPLESGPDDFRLRLRYSLSTTTPLFRLSSSRPERVLSLIIGDEIFLHTETRAFDRNRLIIGPSLRWNQSLVIGLQWCSQYAATANPSNYQQTQIIWLTFRQQLRFHPKKTASI